jgi:pimeloyl-ACP methyl ester carboxylesterase
MKRCLPIAAAAFFLQYTLLCIAGFQIDVAHVSSRCSCRTSATALSAKPKDGTLQVTRNLQATPDDNVTKRIFNLSYTIHRPMTLSSQKACPILVLHGGPSVPSNYLFPLVNVVPYRSIIFYDQLGCGKSDEPDDMNA